MVNKIQKNQQLKLQIALAVALIIFAALSRFLPHPANFAPIAAIAIFGGAVLPRKWAVYLPLIAMIVSDIFIGLHSLVLFTWGSFALIALFSNKWLKHISPTNLGIASLSASTLFFVVTNFGVWLEGKLYPHTFDGFISCYYNALPFFRNTVLGDLVYTGLLFGSYALAFKLVNSKTLHLTISLKQ